MLACLQKKSLTSIWMCCRHSLLLTDARFSIIESVFARWCVCSPLQPRQQIAGHSTLRVSCNRSPWKWLAAAHRVQLHAQTRTRLPEDSCQIQTNESWAWHHGAFLSLFLSSHSLSVCPSFSHPVVTIGNFIGDTDTVWHCLPVKHSVLLKRSRQSSPQLFPEGLLHL